MDTTRNDVVTGVLGVFTVSVSGALAVMSLLHFGIRLPILAEALNIPEVAPAAWSYLVGSTLYGVVAYGILSKARWSWAATVVTQALVVLGLLARWYHAPHVGGYFLGPLVVTALVLVLLVMPPGRRALRH